MSLKSFLWELFKGKEPINGRRSISVGEHITGVTGAQLQALAYYIAVDYIASAVSRIEWRTFIGGKEVFGDEYYRLNVQANIDRTAADFWADTVRFLYSNPGEGALIIPYGKSLILADSWSVDTSDNIFGGRKYSDVTYGDYTFPGEFSADEVIAVDFGDDCNFKALLRGYCDTYEDVMTESINKYKVADGERGVLEIDTLQSGSQEAVDRANELMDKDFKTYFASKNAVLPLYDGMKYTATRNSQSQNTSIVNDITNLSAEIFAKTGQTIKVPPALMTGTVADISGAVDNFITFCIAPFAQKISGAVNKTLYGRKVLEGSKVVPDLTAVKNVSAIDMAEKIDKLIADGIYSVNEIRRKLGESRINEPWADEHHITKNYEKAGGADNGGSNNNGGGIDLHKGNGG